MRKFPIRADYTKICSSNLPVLVYNLMVISETAYSVNMSLSQCY